MMTVVFEAPQFRVHITDRVAWIEKKELTGWVLGAQLTIPVSFEALDGSDQRSTLRAAIADFETSRPGDKSLRAALTGYRAPATARVLPRRGAVHPVPHTRSIAKYWTPQPLRPPLATKAL
jgi:hypothetical protein